MKNLTQLSFFVALVFSLFGAEAGAQTYTVRWYDNIGPNNVTIVADYSGFNSPMTLRRVQKNNGPYYSPNWQTIQEDGLAGSGVDTLSFPFGGNFSIQILDGQNGNALLLSVLVTPIQNAIPVIPEPVINVHDIIYGAPPDISLKAQIVSGYGLGRPSYYRTILHCKVVRTSPDDYESTVEWEMPLGVEPQAFFYLPFQFFGDYCFEWKITDEDTSIDSHFGETEVWSSGQYCWSYGSTGFTSDRLKAEFTAFPNPFVDMVTVTSPSTTTYSLVSLNGQVVHQGNLMYGDNMMDFGSIAPGVYSLLTPFGQTKVVKQ